MSWRSFIYLKAGIPFCTEPIASVCLVKAELEFVARVVFNGHFKSFHHFQLLVMKVKMSIGISMGPRLTVIDRFLKSSCSFKLDAFENLSKSVLKALEMVFLFSFNQKLSWFEIAEGRYKRPVCHLVMTCLLNWNKNTSNNIIELDFVGRQCLNQIPISPGFLLSIIFPF